MPCVGGAAPLERENQADNAREEDEIAERVQLLNLGEPTGGLLLELLVWNVQDETDHDHRTSTYGEIDIETPTP